MVRTPLGVLGDFLLRLRRLWFDLFEDCIRQAFVDATKKIVLSILFLDDSISFAYLFFRCILTEVNLCTRGASTYRNRTFDSGLGTNYVN